MADEHEEPYGKVSIEWIQEKFPNEVATREANQVLTGSDVANMVQGANNLPDNLRGASVELEYDAHYERHLCNDGSFDTEVEYVVSVYLVGRRDSIFSNATVTLNESPTGELVSHVISFG